ncbi:hypothetical protein MAPG_05016 [Magnaporthiopsis poae ATCC 64411]|uniref:Monopolin complex subunit Csm1/Pcs1 C-terminal domain-containing protein n=1 Tax=Magnaporthiopsis poae (strain ATCC 64411 / 73-15) TaxID=644358 RepID=A0A0C4DYA4_MAGP6|nr:hypothetical protein MAPG_05016 [Magnaporthiopsis poae ATCC 64411]
MSKAAARHNLLGLVDEDSEDDLVEENKPIANTARKRTASGAPTTTSMPPAKKRGGATAAATAKGRGGAANRVTKPAAKTGPAARRRASDQVAAALAEAEAEAAVEAPAPRNQPARRGAGRGRGGTARGRVIASTQQDDDPEAEEEHDETGGAEASVLSPPDSDTLQTTARRARGRPRAGAAAATGTKRPATRDAPEQVEEAPEPAPVPARRGRKPAAGTKAKAAAAAAPEMEDETLEIPETQQPREDTMDVDAAEDDFTGPLVGDELTEISPLRSPPGPAIRHSSISPTKARSAMDLDESDSSLRRRLGELTRKHDALEAKYRDLREIGVKEAERTFERFKKQTEERDKAANDLIAKLKEELAAQKELAREGQRHKKDLEAKQAEAAALASQVAALEGAVAEAKKEVKTLAAKLASSRTMVEAAASSKVVPGSALKPGLGSALKPGTAAARAAAASAEAMQSAAQAAQMKEDLYGDLTGLIVRGVKRTAEEDVFDCIQTGRNGTLHFKLSIGSDLSAESYDQVQFMYMPQLDPSRDRALIEMLPDYLVEEISFPRPHAAKFYSRVMRSLTERVE